MKTKDTRQDIITRLAQTARQQAELLEELAANGEMSNIFTGG